MGEKRTAIRAARGTTDATAVDVGPRVDPTIKSLASCIQEILNIPVGAQAHDRDFCAILQARSAL
jgi:hypothetical protein